MDNIWSFGPGSSVPLSGNVPTTTTTPVTSSPAPAAAVTSGYSPDAFKNSQAYKDFMANPANMMGTSDVYYSPYFGQMGSGSVGRAMDTAYEKWKNQQTGAVTSTPTAATPTTAPAVTAPSPFSGTSSTSSAPSVSPISQQETQAGVAPYMQPYVSSMLGATMGQLYNVDASGNVTGLRPYIPYSYNPADYVAGFTPLQQQAQYAAGNMQLPSQYGPASYLASSAGMGSLGLMPAAFGYGQQASMAGQQYANQATNPYAVGAYMSPYMQNVVDVQSQQAKRQAAIARQQQQAEAARSGAFGGGRDVVQRAQANAELQRNLQNLQATGSQNAYQQALQSMQFGSNLGLQGLQAGLQGVNAAQAAANAANQAAATLGTLGGQQQAAQAAQIALQNQLGQQQQQQQQQIINQAIQNYQTAQQYPFMQLGFMQNMMGGLPIQTTSQQTYQAAPSIASQLAGAGLGIAGISKLLAGDSSAKGTTGTTGSDEDILTAIWKKITGVNKEGGLISSHAKGGTVQAQPAGLVDLAISKM